MMDERRKGRSLLVSRSPHRRPGAGGSPVTRHYFSPQRTRSARRTVRWFFNRCSCS